jgi:hypothetical protein
MVFAGHLADFKAPIDGQGGKPEISEIEALRGRASLGRHGQLSDEAGTLKAGQGAVDDRSTSDAA